MATWATGRKAARLNQATIVDAAIRIAARGETDALTGSALGKELGVDRSAVWRHFTDKDALLRSVGDRLLVMALEQVPEGISARARLEALARAIVQRFVEHPCVARYLEIRMTWGRGEFAIVEFMLEALDEMGLQNTEIPLYQRMLAEAILAFAGSCANYASLSTDARAEDESAWHTHYALANPRVYPAIAVHAVGLARTQPDSILDAYIAALLDAVQVRCSQKPCTGPTGRPGEAAYDSGSSDR